MTLELIKNNTEDSVWNWRTQEENLTIINRLFQPNADTYINISDFYLVSSTATSIKLQGHYTEDLINRLLCTPFVDRFFVEKDHQWFTSKSCIQTEINNKVVKFTLDITLTYDEQ